MDFVNEPAVEQAVSDSDEVSLQQHDMQEITERKEELPPKEYIASKKSWFFEQNKGTFHLEDEWNMLRSQLNSGLMLGISQENIDKYAVLNYTYEQREILKFAMFTGISDTVIARMMVKKTWGEMLAEMDASKVGPIVTDLVDKPLNAISRTLESYVSSFNSFRSETEACKSEYENRIHELEALIANKEEEMNGLQQKIQEIEKAGREEQERARQESEMRSRIEEMATERVKELMAEQAQREYERNQMKQEIYRQMENQYGLDFLSADGCSADRNGAGWSLFAGRNKRRRRKSPDVGEVPPIRRIVFKSEKLPANFNLSAYMMSADLSSSQMEIITLAVKTGVDDSVIKQMIDSRLPAQQLKQVLEVVLARSAENGIAGIAEKKEDTYGGK